MYAPSAKNTVGVYIVAAAISDVERFLRVGTDLVIDFDPGSAAGTRAKTTLRGWKQGEHILTDCPTHKSGMYIMLHVNQPCVLRFLFGSEACAFDSKVVLWDRHDHSPYLRLDWPGEIHRSVFRAHERVHMQEACTISGPDTRSDEGTILDLSEEGCGIRVAERYDAGDTVSLSFRLPDGIRVEGISTHIRNVRDEARGFLLGCQFGEEQPELKHTISFFLARMRQPAPGADTSRPDSYIVIIDSDVGRLHRLRTEFETADLAARSSLNVLDGVCLLRMGRPTALVASAGMHCLEICQFLQDSSGLENLPVIVYSDGENAAGGVEYPGNTRTVSGTETLLRDVVAAVRECLEIQE